VPCGRLHCRDNAIFFTISETDLWKASRERILVQKLKLMAEVTQSGDPKSNGRVRVKKLSVRIDMTPMVDLAFLLLTFFILTSTFMGKQVIEMQMPDNEGQPPHANASNVLNLVLDNDDKVYWWIGLDPPVNSTDYSSRGVRKVLLEKAANRSLTVLIKPKDDSRYENIVDILDEIQIANIERYSIVNYSDDDKLLMQQARINE
jgi:biopolymer transport protein ExbD